MLISRAGAVNPSTSSAGSLPHVSARAALGRRHCPRRSDAGRSAVQLLDEAPGWPARGRRMRSMPSTAIVSGPLKGSTARISTRAPGSSPSVAQVAQERPGRESGTRRTTLVAPIGEHDQRRVAGRRRAARPGRGSGRRAGRGSGRRGPARCAPRARRTARAPAARPRRAADRSARRAPGGGTAPRAGGAGSPASATWAPCSVSSTPLYGVWRRNPASASRAIMFGRARRGDPQPLGELRRLDGATGPCRA